MAEEVEGVVVFVPRVEGVEVAEGFEVVVGTEGTIARGAALVAIPGAAFGEDDGHGLLLSEGVEESL
jgi:hypothetical protein